MAAYYQLPEEAQEERQRLRCEFLMALQADEAIFQVEGIPAFLTQQIQPEDLDSLRWHTPGEVVEYCEILFGFPFQEETETQRVRELVNELLRLALRQFELHGELDKMVRLLQLAPISTQIEDVELARLHNRAYLYETSRVNKNRRLLFIYLVLQAVLVLFVFPLLFINTENGAIQASIEAASETDLPEENLRQFSYLDGLYWSLITAASIGYGDITPMTALGKTIAAVLGIMGVITIGVVAGLILRSITPRWMD